MTRAEMREREKQAVKGCLAPTLAVASLVLASLLMATPVVHASPTNPTLAETTYVNDLHTVGLADRQVSQTSSRWAGISVTNLLTGHR